MKLNAVDIKMTEEDDTGPVRWKRKEMSAPGGVNKNTLRL